MEVADRVGTKGVALGVALGVAPPTTLLAPLAGGWGGGGDAGWDVKGCEGMWGGGEGLRPCRRGVILRELFMLSLPS